MYVGTPIGYQRSLAHTYVVPTIHTNLCTHMHLVNRQRRHSDSDSK